MAGGGILRDGLPAPSRVADTVAATLAAAGIRRAFGVPGGEVVALIDALDRAGIRFHLARHETAAAEMAIGSATIDGTAGLLVTTLGPGLANAVDGIADAAQEHAPLIVLSGIVERSIRHRYTHQLFDQAALLRPLVKASFEIEAGAAGATVARALALATEAPAGPVHLDLAPSVAMTADDGKAVPRLPPSRHWPRPDRADPGLAKLRDRLATVKRPIVVAGMEAAEAGAGSVLTHLVRDHGVPIVTTYKAKGVVDENLPRSLGGAGLSPKADEVLLPLVGAADLVLLAGYDPIEMRSGWLAPFQPDAEVVEIGRAAADHGMHTATHRIAGEVGQTLEAAFRGLALNPVWTGGEIEAARARLDRLFSPPDSGFGPHAVVDALDRVLPAGRIVTVDSGAHRILLSQRWKARRPLELLQSAGFCTMACALPLAIGAKLAKPEAPVVAVVGDGGLEMGLGELGTLRDEKVAVVVVVFQDESLALIELKQAAAGLRRLGVGLGATDLPAIARAFGGDGVEVRSVEALESAIRRALAGDRFTLIACRIEADAYVDRI